MKKNFWIKFSVFMSLIAVVLAIDLVSKYFFYDKADSANVIAVIPYIINFKRLPDLNYGAAWGIMGGKQVFLIVLSFVFLAIFVVYYIKEKNKSWLMNITFAFLIAGCVGNLIDRLFLGGVRDFIQFAFWQSFPTFNFADVFLCVGVVLFIVYMTIFLVKANKKDKKENIEKSEGDKDDK